MDTTKAWAVLRDGKHYVSVPTKRKALDVCDVNKPGSKHRWQVLRVTICPNGKLKARER